MRLPTRMIVVLLLAGAGVGHAPAQSVRSLVNSGNDHYGKGEYGDAEVNYRKALERQQSLLPGRFNLGNALHKQGKFQESISEYETLLRPTTPREAEPGIHYNIGNSFLKQQQYQEAIRSYIEALKRDPSDADAKYNLSYALEKLRQQQQQKQDKNKDKDKDKNKDKNQQDQDKQNQQNQKNQQQQQKNQQQQPPQQNQQQQARQQEKKMSKADAERILQVLRNSEKDVQKKLRARQAVRPRSEKDW